MFMHFDTRRGAEKFEKWLVQRSRVPGTQVRLKSTVVESHRRSTTSRSFSSMLPQVYQTGG
jgi:hypothetical protein